MHLIWNDQTNRYDKRVPCCVDTKKDEEICEPFLLNEKIHYRFKKGNTSFNNHGRHKCCGPTRLCRMCLSMAHVENEGYGTKIYQCEPCTRTII